MENGIRMEKLFLTWEFLIPTTLNLLENGVGNIDNFLIWQDRPPHSHPTPSPSLNSTISGSNQHFALPISNKSSQVCPILVEFIALNSLL